MESILKHLPPPIFLRLEVLGIALPDRLTTEDGLDALQDLLGQLGQQVDRLHRLYQLLRTSGPSDRSRDVGVDDAPGHRQLRLGRTQLISNCLELSQRFKGLLLFLLREVSLEYSQQVWVVVESCALGNALIVLSCEDSSSEGGPYGGAK